MTQPSADGLGPVCRRRARTAEQARTAVALTPTHGTRQPGADQLTLDDQEHN